jgi:hypothetical protein
MNTFLKVLGIIFLFLIAMKLAPIVVGPILMIGGLMIGIAAAVLAGVWAAAVLGLVVVAALTPVWLPIALFVGLIALICRLVRGPARAA